MQTSGSREQRIRMAIGKAVEAFLEAMTAYRDGSDTAAPENAQPPFPEVYLSARQLSQRIPYSRQSIYNMIHNGTLVEGEHFTRKGGRPIFFWSKVERWLRSAEPRYEEPMPEGRARTGTLPEGPFVPSHRLKRVAGGRKLADSSASQHRDVARHRSGRLRLSRRNKGAARHPR